MSKKRKLQLSKVLNAIDNKDRDFYDNLTEEEKKEFSGYLMLRYASSVQGSYEMQHYYLASANYYANKYMFDLSKHPKLQWLMLTAISPNISTQYHKWIKQKPKVKNNNDIRKKLAELYPAMKNDDLDILSKLITKKELNEYIKAHGDN